MRQAKINTMTQNSSNQLTSSLIKVKGYNLGLVVGSNDITLNMPSEANQMLGIAFNQSFGGDFSMTVNNEIVHEKISPNFAVPTPAGALGLQPYFPVNRKLRGQDDLRLSINSTVALTVNMIVFYK